MGAPHRFVLLCPTTSSHFTWPDAVVNRVPILPSFGASPLGGAEGLADANAPGSEVLLPISFASAARKCLSDTVTAWPDAVVNRVPILPSFGASPLGGAEGLADANAPGSEVLLPISFASAARKCLSDTVTAWPDAVVNRVPILPSFGASPLGGAEGLADANAPGSEVLLPISFASAARKCLSDTVTAWPDAVVNRVPILPSFGASPLGGAEGLADANAPGSEVLLPISFASAARKCLSDTVTAWPDAVVNRVPILPSFGASPLGGAEGLADANAPGSEVLLPISFASAARKCLSDTVTAWPDAVVNRVPILPSFGASPLGGAEGLADANAPGSEVLLPISFASAARKCLSDTVTAWPDAVVNRVPILPSFGASPLGGAEGLADANAPGSELLMWSFACLAC
eukprot:gene12990-biopygen9523